MIFAGCRQQARGTFFRWSDPQTVLKDRGGWRRSWRRQLRRWFPCRAGGRFPGRSEEHTSELQSQSNLVCRLLLEKKKQEVLYLARRIGAQYEIDWRVHSGTGTRVDDLGLTRTLPTGRPIDAGALSGSPDARRTRL